MSTYLDNEGLGIRTGTPEVFPTPPEYHAVDPTGQPTERTTWAPHVFCNRAALWEPILGASIDEMSSDPRTLNLLSDLIRFTEGCVSVTNAR